MRNATLATMLWIATSLVAHAEGLPGFEGLEAGLAPRSESRVLEQSWFDPMRDTPAFANFASTYGKRPATPGHGNCFGMNYLTVHWFQTFVVGVTGKGFGRGGEIRNQLGVAGPVRLDNLSRYRLHSYSSDSRRQEALRREVMKFHWDQLVVHSMLPLSSEGLYEATARDIRNPRTQLAMLAIESGDAKHSLLAYRIDETVVTGPNGQPRPVRRVHFYDPNFPVDSHDQSAMYLMYFPGSQKWACSPKWMALYSKVRWQQGSFLKDDQLRFAPANDAIARAASQVWNAVFGGVASSGRVLTD